SRTPFGFAWLRDELPGPSSYPFTVACQPVAVVGVLDLGNSGGLPVRVVEPGSQQLGPSQKRRRLRFRDRGSARAHWGRDLPVAETGEDGQVKPICNCFS